MKKLLIGCVGLAGLVLLGIVALAIVGAVVGSRQPTTIASSKPAAPMATAVQAATSVPTLPPTQATTRPTATPRPTPLAIGFTGRFEPTLLRVGQKLVVELGVENKSDRPIEGLRIFSSGPWNKFTVVNVLPAGRFESGMLGYNVYSGQTVPPGQKRAISIVAYPNEPGTHEFSFIPNRDTEALKDEKGEGIVIGGKVNVTR